MAKDFDNSVSIPSAIPLQRCDTVIKSAKYFHGKDGTPDEYCRFRIELHDGPENCNRVLEFYSDSSQGLLSGKYRDLCLVFDDTSEGPEFKGRQVRGYWLGESLIAIEPLENAVKSMPKR